MRISLDNNPLSRLFAFKGKNANKYTPGGRHSNVRGTYVKNQKIGEQMNAMHDAWHSKKFGAAN